MDADERYENALAGLDQAIQELVAAVNNRDGTDYMLNKWYLAGQCVVASDQSVTMNFGEMSKNCPLSDQLGMLVYCDSLIRARIAKDDDD